MEVQETTMSVFGLDKSGRGEYVRVAMYVSVEVWSDCVCVWVWVGNTELVPYLYGIEYHYLQHHAMFITLLVMMYHTCNIYTDM